MKSDGEAVFGSNVDAVYFRGDATAGGNIVFRGMLNGSTTSNIYGDGSASFAGNITCGDVNADVVKINAPGSIQIRRDSSTATAFGIYQGGTGAGNATITLQGNGSASFGGIVQTSNASTNNIDDGNGAKLDPKGEMIVRQDNGPSSAIGIVSGANASNNTFRVNGDGSASFGGQLTVDRNLGSGNNGASIRVEDGGAIKTRLNNDGSAEFAGGDGITVNQSIGITRFGGLLQRDDASLANLHQVYKGGSAASNVTYTLRNDGSASFAGSVSTGHQTITGAGGAGGVGFTYTYSGSTKVSFTNTGTATFAGNITAGNVSDIKFKENITNANPQLSDVVALGGILKNWDWKEEAPLNDELKAKRFLGLIAQEAEQICPGVTYEVQGEGKIATRLLTTTSL